MIIIGLGTNLGDREANLNLAIEMIEQELLRNVKRSKIIETPPMLPENAPEDWNINFLNIAISGELKRRETPQEALAILKIFETQIGRQPSERWAPREIDLDILAWDNEVVNEPNLQIPHYGLTEREFAIVPFAELAPNWVHPETGITAAEYAEKFLKTNQL